MVGVIKAPVTTDALNRAWAWRTACDWWELWGEWGQIAPWVDPLATTVGRHELRLVVWGHVDPDQIRAASADGAAEFVVADCDELFDFTDEDFYAVAQAWAASAGRMRVVARFNVETNETADSLIARCAKLGDVNLWPQPLFRWRLALTPEEARELAEVAYLPPAVILRAAAGLPFKCQGLRVVEAADGCTTACPFREVPGTRAVHPAEAAYALAGEAAGCQTGCYMPHPVGDRRQDEVDFPVVEEWQRDVVDGTCWHVPSQVKGAAR